MHGPYKTCFFYCDPTQLQCYPARVLAATNIVNRSIYVIAGCDFYATFFLIPVPVTSQIPDPFSTAYGGAWSVNLVPYCCLTSALLLALADVLSCICPAAASITGHS